MRQLSTLGLLAVIGAIVTSGCRGQQPALAVAVTPATAATPAPPCVRVDGVVPAGTHADTLSGRYRLTLVAETGSRSGHSTSGSLVLARYGSHLPPVASGGATGTRYPLYGSTSITPDSVGAAAPGDVAATDIDAPGALMLEWPTVGMSINGNGMNMLLRLGARANRGGSTPIEGEHLALTLTAMSAQRFVGRWSSGLPGKTATGYFCADRI